MPSGKKYNPIQRTNNGRVPFSVNANELQRAIRGMPSVNGNPGNSVSQFGNSFNIVNNLPGRFTIKILSGTNPYAWESVIDDTANTWSTFNDGPAGTTTSIPAYEINGNAAVPANTLVDAWFGANYEVMYFEYAAIEPTSTYRFELNTSSTQSATFSKTVLNMFAGVGNSWISHSGGVFTFSHTGTIRVHISWNLTVEVSTSGGNIQIDLDTGSVGFTRVPLLCSQLSFNASTPSQLINLSASGTINLANGNNLRLAISGSGTSIVTGTSAYGGICFDSRDPI